jgi:DNA-binding PadR family transcriptional regulator
MLFDELDAAILTVLAEQGEMDGPSLIEALEVKTGVKIPPFVFYASMEFLEEFDYAEGRFSFTADGQASEMHYAITGKGHQERIYNAARPQMSDEHIPGTGPELH